MMSFPSRVSRVAIISSKVASSSVSLSTKSSCTATSGANGSSEGSPIITRLRPFVLKACASRREPARRPRERYGVSDVVELADPLDEALHPHPKARVLHAAKAAGVEIPIVRLRVLSLFLEAFLDCLQVRLPLAASDDLADAIAADHVQREDEVRMLRVTGLVEGLVDSRIVRRDDLPRFALREVALLEDGAHLAPFNVPPFILQA